MIEITDLNEVVNGDSSVISQMTDFDHEQIVFCQDKAAGLKAIIAIHNTVLGPALGGTRMWAYQSEKEALTDVLRLSRGMTYKSSLAGLNLGGGKAVIIGDARKDKNEALMRRFGKFVDSLAGKYITAEDVGMSLKDMEYVRMETENVAGLPEYMGGSGDPSPFTAYGVYMGMKAATKEQFGSDSLLGKKVMVQGIGSVGSSLIDHLMKEGAIVSVSDIYQDRIDAVVAKHGVEVVHPDHIYDADMEIYAPCALGATVNDNTLSRLKCSIIAGAANNQLAQESKHGIEVMKKGIVYVPDYLINAGGIINCYWEVIGYSREAAMSGTEKIYDTALKIFKLSKDENIPTYLAANRLAEDRLKAIGNVKLSF